MVKYYKLSGRRLVVMTRLANFSRRGKQDIRYTRSVYEHGARTGKLLQAAATGGEIDGCTHWLAKSEPTRGLDTLAETV